MEKQKKIFIVEDEGVISMDISAMLRNKGFRIAGIASNGEEALSGIAKEKPDLVLMDIILPGPIDGVAVAGQLKSSGNIPFIYLTAHSDESTLNRAKATEPYGFIVKPVNETELYSMVVTALYKHEMEQELQVSMEELEAANEELRVTNDDLTRSQNELLELHSRLKESEEKFRLAFTTSPDSVNINRLTDGLYIDINEGFTAMTGYTREDVIGRTSLEINIWDDPDDRGRLVDGLKKHGLVNNLEAVFRLKDGSKKTALMSARIFMLKSVPHILSLTRDIDEMKKLDEQLRREMEITASSLAEKELLLREVHHRVENNFQIIISMLNLQVKQISDPSQVELFRDTRNRIRAMALIHEKLYRSPDLAHIDFAGYLDLMVTELRRIYAPSLRSIAVKVDSEEVSMGIDQAIPCGLIVNELVTNAMKYAFPRETTGSGCITISLKRRGDEVIELSVCDNGIGMPENVHPETTESLGLNIVHLLAKHQLGGEIRFDGGPGTHCTVRFIKK